MSKAQSKVCTQSTDARCSAAYLSSIFGTRPGIIAAYCNDQYFVVHTTNAIGGTANLDSVPFPPGGTQPATAPNAGAACRTRSSSVTNGYNVNKFLLSPTLLSTAAASNNANTQVFPNGGGDGNGMYLMSPSGAAIGLPSAAGIGFTISGQQLFPMYNNRGALTPQNCEVDACNSHVGQGGGQPHLHGDPWGPTCLYYKQNYTTGGLYNTSVHPPLVGFSFDGYSIYGRHLSASAVGASVALDACGGHSHDCFGYHYHHQTVQGTTDGNGAPGIAAGLLYPASTTGVYQCWRGDLSKDAYYNSGNGGPAVQPCAGSTQWFAQPGITIPGVAALATSPATSAAVCGSTPSSSSAAASAALPNASLAALALAAAALAAALAANRL